MGCGLRSRTLDFWSIAYSLSAITSLALSFLIRTLGAVSELINTKRPEQLLAHNHNDLYCLFTTLVITQQMFTSIPIIYQALFEGLGMYQ